MSLESTITVGDRIRRLDNHQDLTKGKVYQVIGVTLTHFRVMSDRGRLLELHKAWLRSKWMLVSLPVTNEEAVRYLRKEVPL